ncbi:MAG TPA: GNAT family N-acetyltransferase [Candidatus Saccharimonadia bacterium]|nr:GNAT family N-acetyltransferase [Candidatus Saccharimonadia bacterium]
MLSILRDLWWKFWFPWSRNIVGQIRPLRISICPENRLAECERLYLQNIPHGLPADHFIDFSSTLRSGSLLVLLVESEDRLVGTFSLNRCKENGVVSLCYVLVDPEHHRSGIGTTMFFASVALLSLWESNVILAITALPGTEPFYRRLGFLRTGEMLLPDGLMVELAVLYVWPHMSRNCRKWLVKGGAHLPESGYEIPTTTHLQPDSATLTEQH